jgi:uncharacterized protein GlcG (DUF336 family)
MKETPMRSVLTVSFLSLAALTARADALHDAPLPLAVLLDAAQATIAACKKDGYTVGVTVVDADLSTRLSLRADGAHEDTLLFSFRKAYTAAKTGMSSGDFGKTVPNSAQLDPKPGSGPPVAPGPVNGDAHLITWPGAFPIVVNGRLVGAIGAGGAPGGEKDEACVKAGLARIPGIDK